MAASKEQILEAISNMTIMEVVDLVKLMEDKFGVSAAAPVAIAAATPTTANTAGDAWADLRDSDLDNSGLITFTMGNPAVNHHSFDAGYRLPPGALGGVVFLDLNNDGRRTGADTIRAGTALEIWNADASVQWAAPRTNLAGKYTVTGLPDGEPGGGPQRAGVPVADIITGMYASIAICAALAHRARSGKGQHLDLALLDSQIALLAYQNTNYFATGKPPRRIGNLHPNIVPYQPFRASDGEVILACGNDNLYRKFCAAAGCAELAEDPRFATNGKRVENRDELTRLLGAIFARRTKKEWVALLDAAGVPNGPINDIAQVFDEPQVRARGVRIEVAHPVAGKLPMVASPMRFSGTPLEHKVPPPLLGEHTEAVLRELLGKTEDQIARLRESGVL